MQFFLLQATAITFEDLIKWMWKRSRFQLPPLCTRLIGHTWVVFSLWLTLPFVGDVLVRMRTAEGQFLPYSLAAQWVYIIPPPPQ